MPLSLSILAVFTQSLSWFVLNCVRFLSKPRWSIKTFRKQALGCTLRKNPAVGELWRRGWRWLCTLLSSVKVIIHLRCINKFKIFFSTSNELIEISQEQLTGLIYGPHRCCLWLDRFGRLWVRAESVCCSEACQMLLYQHLFYHLKRLILPTMTVIPSERATLTEASHHGWAGLTECAHLHFLTCFLWILPRLWALSGLMFGLPEFMHSMKKKKRKAAHSFRVLCQPA